MGRILARVAMILITVLLTLTYFSTATITKRDKPPNIVVILVDDQDYHLHSMDHMQVLQSQLIQQGIWFTKHYGHVSQCCPARVTLWTGRHAHSTDTNEQRLAYG